jgi:ParB-like chromosome segregation protein Spo0J
MALREVLLSDLVLDLPPLWSNPRSFTGLNKQSIAELGDDIKSRERDGAPGIQVPLKVQRVIVPDRAEPLELVLDGQRRYLGVKAAGYKDSTPIVVVDHMEDPLELNAKSSAMLLLDIMAAANYRESLSTYEQAMAAQRLRADHMDQADIARALRRSPSWVSRFLKALGQATPKLLEDWRSGKVTDEQFKDLADVKTEEQGEALEQIKEIRAKGDKSSARAQVKEVSGKAKAAKAASKASAKKAKPVTAKALAKLAKADKPTRGAAPIFAPTKAVLAQLVALADKKKPHHEYAKGVLDGVRYCLGELDESKLGKAWHDFAARASGIAKPAKVSGYIKKPKEKSAAARKKVSRAHIKKLLARSRAARAAKK